MNETLVIFAVSTFGLLKGIDFIHGTAQRQFEPFPDHSYKSIWMHFGLLFETMAYILVYLNEIQSLVKMEHVESPRLLSELKTTPRRVLGDKILEEAGLLVSYTLCREQVHKYRNQYTHEPGVALMRKDRTSPWMALKKDDLIRSADYNFMIKHRGDDEHFEIATDSVNVHLKETMLVFDRIFEELVIPRFAAVVQQPEFSNLLSASAADGT